MAKIKRSNLKEKLIIIIYQIFHRVLFYSCMTIYYVCGYFTFLVIYHILCVVNQSMIILLSVSLSSSSSSALKSKLQANVGTNVDVLTLHYSSTL